MGPGRAKGLNADVVAVGADGEYGWYVLGDTPRPSSLWECLEGDTSR